VIIKMRKIMTKYLLTMFLMVISYPVFSANSDRTQKKKLPLPIPSNKQQEDNIYYELNNVETNVAKENKKISKLLRKYSVNKNDLYPGIYIIRKNCLEYVDSE